MSPQRARISDINTHVWATGSFVSQYAHDGLSAAEQAVVEQYADELRGRVLELGCGAGRITRHLAELATEVVAIDAAPAMVEACRAAAIPRVTVEQRDLRDLSPYADRSFRAVVAGADILDIFDDDERRDSLAAICRVLEPGGLLVMSSHNRAARGQARPLRQLRASTWPRTLGRIALLPWRAFNRVRLMSYERQEAEYAIVNDDTLDNRLLHYYIDRDAQQRQLEAAGYEFVAALDEHGALIAPGGTAETAVDIHYLARRAE